MSAGVSPEFVQRRYEILLALAVIDLDTSTLACLCSAAPGGRLLNDVRRRHGTVPGGPRAVEST